MFLFSFDCHIDISPRIVLHHISIVARKKWIWRHYPFRLAIEIRLLGKWGYYLGFEIIAVHVLCWSVILLSKAIWFIKIKFEATILLSVHSPLLVPPKSDSRILRFMCYFAVRSHEIYSYFRLISQYLSLCLIVHYVFVNLSLSMHPVNIKPISQLKRSLSEVQFTYCSGDTANYSFQNALWVGRTVKWPDVITVVWKN